MFHGDKGRLDGIGNFFQMELCILFYRFWLYIYGFELDV